MQSRSKHRPPRRLHTDPLGTRSDSVSYGGMDYKDVKESLRLISEEVIPEVNRRINEQTTAAAAAVTV
ncbi:hypothetical protein [Rhodococcus oxybenzonivorans]|uniref:hypothetical protein n=1 Tax=Rhodococcus oxybenzonivorans TaxID=1990687 RepID=UPI0013A55157|nr:hypothetical protein [Rhodococcus oxybenzonivorans]